MTSFRRSNGRICAWAGLPKSSCSCRAKDCHMDEVHTLQLPSLLVPWTLHRAGRLKTSPVLWQSWRRGNKAVSKGSTYRSSHGRVLLCEQLQYRYEASTQRHRGQWIRGRVRVQHRRRLEQVRAYDNNSNAWVVHMIFVELWQKKENACFEPELVLMHGIYSKFVSSSCSGIRCRTSCYLSLYHHSPPPRALSFVSRCGTRLNKMQKVLNPYLTVFLRLLGKQC